MFFFFSSMEYKRRFYSKHPRCSFPCNETEWSCGPKNSGQLCHCFFISIVGINYDINYWYHIHSTYYTNIVNNPAPVTIWLTLQHSRWRLYSYTITVGCHLSSNGKKKMMMQCVANTTNRSFTQNQKKLTCQCVKCRYTPQSTGSAMRSFTLLYRLQHCGVKANSMIGGV